MIMMRTVNLMLFLGAAFAFASASFSQVALERPASMPSSLVDRIRARDQSIASASIQLTRYFFELRDDPGSQIKIAVQRVRDNPESCLETTDRLRNSLASLAGSMPPALSIKTVERGQLFLTETTFPAGDKQVSDYDGQRMAVLTETNKQLDIFPGDKPRQAWTLEKLGLTMRRFLSGEFPISIHGNADGTTDLALDLGENKGTTSVTVDQSLRILELRSEANGVLRIKNDYLGGVNRQGYDIPQVIIMTRYEPASESKYVAELIYITDIKLNPSITDKQLSIRERIMPWTTVVDYRHNPPAVSRDANPPEFVAEAFIDSKIETNASRRESDQTSPLDPKTYPMAVFAAIVLAILIVAYAIQRHASGNK